MGFSTLTGGVKHGFPECRSRALKNFRELKTASP
jgi:hypothetical protein